MKFFLIGAAIPLILLVVFLTVFRKQLKASREKEGSIYQKLFKRENKDK